MAAKVGLFKICLGIALVIGAMKFLVLLSWALAIFKYVPDPYIYYNTVDYKKSQFHFDPYDHHRHGHDPDHVHYDHGQDPFRFLDKFSSETSSNTLLDSVLRFFKIQSK